MGGLTVEFLCKVIKPSAQRVPRQRDLHFECNRRLSMFDGVFPPKEKALSRQDQESFRLLLVCWLSCCYSPVSSTRIDALF